MSNQEDLQLPDILDVSPEATAAVEAELDPNVKPPVYATKTVDTREGRHDEYFRWSDTLLLEKVFRTLKPNYTEFFVQAKIRPNDKGSENINVGRRVFCRYRINFKVLAKQEVNAKAEIMNRISMPALLSLIKSSGFMPSDKTAGLPAELLMHLFPKEDQGASPLKDKVLIGIVVNKPNKGNNAKYERQTEVESWLPVANATEE